MSRLIVLAAASLFIYATRPPAVRAQTPDPTHPPNSKATSQPSASQPASRPAKIPSVVLALDATSSMVDKLEVFRRRVGEALNLLTAKQLFAVVVAAEKIEVYKPVLVLASQSHKVEATKWVDQYKDGGRARFIDLIKRAIAYKPDVLWIMTDAEIPQVEVRESIDLLRKYAAAQRLCLYFTWLGGNADPSLFWDLTQATAGKFLSPDGEEIFSRPGEKAKPSP